MVAAETMCGRGFSGGDSLSQISVSGMILSLTEVSVEVQHADHGLTQSGNEAVEELE